MASAVRSLLAGRLAEAAGMPSPGPEFAVGRPPDRSMGDYALPCFAAAKLAGMSPQKLAADIAAKLKPGGIVSSAMAAGPFVNLTVDRAELARGVLGSFTERESSGRPFGSSDDGAGRTVVIEYSSPNIAKPFSIGHLRSTIIGQALAAIHGALGYRVVRINFLGDWGTQFGMMIAAFRRWGNDAELASGGIRHLVDLYVRANKEAKSDPSIEADARSAFRELEEGGKEATELWRRFRESSLREFDAIYSRLGVRFDVTTGESAQRESLGRLIEQFKSAGLARVSQGALVVEVDEGRMPPCMLLKSDGGSTYATRDIAAAIERQASYGFERMLYVVGSDQKLHFRQIFRALEMLGADWARRCVHVDFGLVRLGTGKMSTREGNVVLLEDVLGRSAELARHVIEEKNPDLPGKAAAAEAVGLGAVKFADLCRKRSKDVSFEWEEILRFDGETGPYLQYTHARLASILRKAASAASGQDAEPGVLVEGEEAEVVILLDEFEERLREAAESCEPCVVAQYLLELAAAANRFYNAHKVLGSGGQIEKARLLLARAAKTVLGRGLKLLGIEALEEM